MPERPRQLVLDLPLETRFGVEDFLIGPSNEEAFAAIERWPDWPDTLLRLEGPRGSGKSHLGAIWAGWAGAIRLDARAVTADLVPSLPAGTTLVVEDVDRGPLDEGALFHLLNRARESGAGTLFTTTRAVEGCGIATPDLLSRLRRAPSAVLLPPDEALLKAVLVKLFVDRQLVVDTSVIDYVATRIERSLARARDFVAEIDREAMSRGRRVTRAVAAGLLAEAGDATGNPS